MKILTVTGKDIEVTGEAKYILVSGQAGVDTIRFVVPRTYDGINGTIDLGTYPSWYLRFKNSKNEGEPVLLESVAVNDTTITIDWTPSGTSIQESGDLMVQIWAYLDDTHQWPTSICHFWVQGSLPADSNITPTGPTVFEQYLTLIKAQHDSVVSDAADAATQAAQAVLDSKVDKVTGKGLSTEDYTTEEKTKLSNIEAGAQVNTVVKVAGKTGDVTLGKSDVGLGNVDNTSDINKPVSTAQQTALDLRIPLSQKGEASGVATLGTDGKVPASQLPSYVDDVLEYAASSAFPATGETGKIYVALDTNLTYRWSGSAYVEISQSLALGETDQTAYRGDRGKIAYDTAAELKNPVYTTTTDLQALASGELLTTAFGKIAKSVLSVIAQLDGRSAYRGTLLASGYDLDTLTLTDACTCYGTSVHAPTSAESFFLFHVNSNVGTVSALQIAFGYTTGKIYTRQKTASAWGSWSVGVTSTELGYLSGITSGIQAQLDAKVAKSDIVDNLESTDATKILSAKQGNILKNLIKNTYSMDWKTVQQIVQAGAASSFFSIGDQIIVNWKDVATGTEYQVPLDVVHFGNITDSSGTTKPGMFLQWHYATPFGVQFSQYQAFYYAVAELPAGTYNITIGTNWGTHCVAGTTYQFTLTQAVPSGGQLSGMHGAPDQDPANWKVYAFASKAATSAQETVSMSVGSDGTSLGTIYSNDTSVLNGLQSVAYGYNRWSQSAVRQWLNSDAAINVWWTAQNNYDRSPDQLSAKAGFLTGFDADFLNVLNAIKIVTFADTLISGGTEDDTYDKFFLPSLEQMYVSPQISGEGDYWEYWQSRLQVTSPVAQYSTNPALIKYALDAHTSAQYVRLRSANRGISTYTWYVTTSGYVTNSLAVDANRLAPACVIC